MGCWTTPCPRRDLWVHSKGRTGPPPANATTRATTGLPRAMLLSGAVCLRVAARPLASTNPPAAPHVAAAPVALSRDAQREASVPLTATGISGVGASAAAAIPVRVGGHRRPLHRLPPARARAPPILLPERARLCFSMPPTSRVPQRPCLPSPASDCWHPPRVPHSVLFFCLRCLFFPNATPPPLRLPPPHPPAGGCGAPT